MNQLGDNLAPVLAAKARDALLGIRQGERDVASFWLEYGDALNAGRAIFPDDNNAFGAWIEKEGLDQLGATTLRRDERAAAMWAAAHPDDLAKMETKYPNVRTIRGWHAKWLEEQKPAPSPPRPAPERTITRTVRQPIIPTPPEPPVDNGPEHEADDDDDGFDYYLTKDRFREVATIRDFEAMRENYNRQLAIEQRIADRMMKIIYDESRVWENINEMRIELIK